MDKSKKNAWRGRGIAALAAITSIAVASGALVACGNAANDANGPNAGNQSVVATTESPAVLEPVNLDELRPVDEAAAKEESKFAVTVDNVEAAKAASGGGIIRVNMKYTNNSDQERCFFDFANVDVVQFGQLVPISSDTTSPNMNGAQMVKPGDTIDMTMCFATAYDDEVRVRVTDYTLGNKVIADVTADPKTGEVKAFSEDGGSEAAPAAEAADAEEPATPSAQ